MPYVTNYATMKTVRPQRTGDDASERERAATGSTRSRSVSGTTGTYSNLERGERME